MDISSITKRQPLNPDDVLYLNGEKCTINSIKGTGTSSVVYEATLEGRKIILKTQTIKTLQKQTTHKIKKIKTTHLNLKLIIVIQIKTIITITIIF